MKEALRGRCANCEWWVKINEKNKGHCHGAPPSVTYRNEGDRVSHFPLTFEYDWCGSFKRKWD